MTANCLQHVFAWRAFSAVAYSPQFKKVNILHIFDLYLFSPCSGPPYPGGAQPDAVFN